VWSRSADSARRAGACLLAVVLAAAPAACGARLSDEEVAAVEGLPVAGEPGEAPGADAARSEGGAGTGEASIGDGDAATAGGNGGTETTAGDDGGPAPSQPPGGNGGATDVGVTGDRIVVGNVSTISGPVPGLFSGGAAWAAYVNSQGGVHGRRVQVVAADDNLDSAANRRNTQDLASKVFAFVGSTSGVEAGGAEVLAQSGVPDIGLALTRPRANLQSQFSPGPVRSDGYSIGPFNYFKQTFPGAEKKAALFWHNQATSKDNAEMFRKVMEAAGYQFVYTAETSPTEPNYTGHVLAMRQEGVRYVFTTMEVSNVARLAKAMEQQNFKVDVPNYGAQVYSQLYLRQAGTAANGTRVNIPHAMFEDGGAVPEMALFIDWMRRTAPNTTPDIFALYGWASGRLFEQALRAAGPRATREALLAELRKIDQFDSNGILALAGPASKRSPECFMVATVADGKWRRADPPSGFVCDKGGFQKVR
jgi:ABC-type branched-subunit amino acid transport system substrate-binding protein